MKKTNWKRRMAIPATVLAMSMLLSSCTGSAPAGSSSAAAGSSAAAAGDQAAEVKKPEKIKIMVDGTFQANKLDGQDAWVKRYEELTGIKLEIIQPDHSAYYDVLGQTFASGVENWPDVVVLSSAYYTGYAAEGALWDMTDTWNNSELKTSGRADVGVIEANMIDGHLYGFSKERGNGCITYIKQKWLDNVGLSIPTNYDEYLKMLEAFSKEDPDGNGVKGDTYAVSSAGLIGAEVPYINYLPEFYQDAYPSFYQKEDGTWADGFTDPAMRGAIERLRDVYSKGYIDKESLTNSTKDCRNKFYEDKFGVFTYWAGTWNTNLKTNLEANKLDGNLVALPPIKEVGSYLERNAPVFAITASCQNPEGVYKYFIENMLDGGDVQMLWTYGVEGVHWSTKAETVLDNTYTDGQFHMYESKTTPGAQFTKINMDPLLSATGFINGDPGADLTAPEAKSSQQIFNSNSHRAPLPVTTDVMNQYNGDLTKLKNSIIADCIVQGISIDEGYARFKSEHGEEWSQAIVDSLNAAK